MIHKLSVTEMLTLCYRKKANMVIKLTSVRLRLQLINKMFYSMHYC